MDLGSFGSGTLDARFLSALAGVILIDLILAGDNAVVIAMAVRALPRERRRRGMLLGAGAAVLARVVATGLVAQLLRFPYLKLAGGVVVGWVALRLFVEGAPGAVRERPATGLWQAVRLIVVADFTMSLDNMIAVGGASGGNLFLPLFGLPISMPLVVFTSGLLVLLLDRYPLIAYAGAAMLGKVAAEMALTDPIVATLVAPPPRALWAAEAAAAAAVILAARLLVRRAAALAERREQAAGEGACRGPRDGDG